MHSHHDHDPFQNYDSKRLARLWAKVCARLIESLGEEAFSRWFKPVKLVSLARERLLFQTPNDIYSVWIEENYLDELTAAFQAELGVVPPIEFELDRNAPDLTASDADRSEDAPELSADDVTAPDPADLHSDGVASAAASETSPPTQSHHAQPLDGKFAKAGKAAGLSPLYSFENFVIGDSNRLAHAASIAVSEKPGRTYHPLFIHSPSGLGKTHLLHAIGWEALRRRAKSKVVYITAEEFANEYIAAIQTNSLISFRKRFRQADLLLIDDIQFLGGKDGMQEEFFHTFNSLTDTHKQIVLASDCPATEIRNLEERLVSRFQWGMTAEVAPPSNETRIAILRRKREERPAPVPDSVIEFIAGRITANVRAMEGALIRAATAFSLGAPMDEASLERSLVDFLGDDGHCRVSVHEIQETVAAHYDVTIRDLTGRRRTSHISMVRHVAMHLSRDLTDLSLAEIGKEFGGRDHGTVIHAAKKIQVRAEKDPGLRRTLEFLRRQLTSPRKGDSKSGRYR
ncbi:MAG: chromosomal replication initiator protein DnaA [Verrucomicrobiae bacterium]|nr:chromosomal replication initiator protein DnaA [Verrucomicrobiae bacterium]MCP5551021.1 chromosomal replication initiator protein DnaA [Akkermansiaceae bacterium]